MIAKGRTAAPKIPMNVGLYLVSIKDIRWARNSKGEEFADENGETSVDIFFETSDGIVVSDRFPMQEKFLWMLDSIRKATGMYDENKQTPADQLIDKKLWIVVAGEVHFDDQEKIRRNPDGTIYFTKSILKKHFQNIDDIRPALFGDPAKNNGIPGGIFLKQQMDLQEYLLQTEKSPDAF